jgi:acetyl esterase
MWRRVQGEGCVADRIDGLTASALDPEIGEFVERINRGYAEQGEPTDMADRRRIAEAVRESWRSGGPPMAETRELTLDGIRLRLHRPVADAVLPVMLYIHGGGWTVFSIDTHDRLMREYAARAGIAVLGIDYSLSPESKFPVALDEIVRVLDWLPGQADALGIDPARILIGGDSAGANLSVAACLRRRDAGQAPLAGMLLNYGAFDADPTESYPLYGGPDYPLSPEEMDGFWANYVSDAAQLTDPLVAPLRAGLHDLPPAFLAVAECDILAGCNHAFARKLAAAGGEVTEVTYAGAAHSFLEAVSIAPLADRALDDQARWLRERCGP